MLLVPWLAALARARSLAGALALAWGMSVGFALAVFSWFASAIASYAGAPAWLGFAALVAFAPLLEPQLLVFAGVRWAARSRAAAALAWVGTEWLAPKLLGDTLGHGLHASASLRQAADLAGLPGLTLLLLLANEGVLAALAARGRTRLALVGAVAAIPLALASYGAWRLSALAPAAGAPPLVTAALVQADISQYARLREELGSFEAVRAILDAHFALSADVLAHAPALDLLVWPETVYPTTFGAPKSHAGAVADRAIAAFVHDAGVPLVFGAYDAEGGAEYNAAVFLSADADGRASFDTYRKTHLFPLTERVPAWLDSAALRAALPWVGAWRAGDGPKVVEAPLRGGRTLRAAPLICYDALVPGHARAAVRAGAELLLALSNDSWFATGEGPHLHLVVSAFRSIETRRPQLRATPTGISAAIDASGEIVARAPVHARQALVASLPAGAPGSLALALGDWLGPASLLACAARLALRRR